MNGISGLIVCLNVLAGQVFLSESELAYTL